MSLRVSLWILSVSAVFFTKTHEYLRPISDKKVQIGLTKHALDQLGEIVYVDVIGIGKQVKSGDEIANLESVKSVGEMYSPVAGTVLSANPVVVDNSENGLAIVNNDPEGEGWIAQIEVLNQSDLKLSDKLIDQASYDQFCEQEKAKENH